MKFLPRSNIEHRSGVIFGLHAGDPRSPEALVLLQTGLWRGNYNIELLDNFCLNLHMPFLKLFALKLKEMSSLRKSR